MDLASILTWVVSGGGAAIIGYWLCNNVPALAQLVGDYKRYAAAGVTAFVAVAAWALLTAGTGTAWPVGWWAWVSQLVGLAAAAFEGGQFIHAATTLAAARKQ
jgi:hypothetical protein